MASLAVTVVGHDGPGIIASVTSVLADLGGNLEDSSMTLLRGHFAWTLIVAVEASPGEVEGRLRPVCDERGLLVEVRELPPEPDVASTGAPYLLTVHGGDRPGIVSAITAVVAARGGNVTDLTTRLAGSLYVLTAEVDLPADADIEALAGELATVAGELGVDAGLRPSDPDLL